MKTCVYGRGNYNLYVEGFFVCICTFLQKEIINKEKSSHILCMVQKWPKTGKIKILMQLKFYL